VPYIGKSRLRNRRMERGKIVWLHIVKKQCYVLYIRLPGDASSGQLFFGRERVIFSV